MADTIRETVIQQMVAALKNYTGFSTISQPTVVRGIEYFDVIESYEMPVISVLPRDDEIERRYGKHVCTMEVELVCAIAFDVDEASIIGEAVYGELMVAALAAVPVGVEDRYVTGGGVINPDSLNQTVLSAAVVMNIQYLTDIGDPYTLTTE